MVIDEREREKRRDSSITSPFGRIFNYLRAFDAFSSLDDFDARKDGLCYSIGGIIYYDVLRCIRGAICSCTSKLAMRSDEY